MNRKLFAGGLLVAVCMCFLAVDGTSQAPPSSTPPPTPTGDTAEPSALLLPGSSPDPLLVTKPSAPSGEASFETLVQELKTVRAQREALNAREKVLLEKIAQKVEEQRKALQKSEEILRQLQAKPDEKPPFSDEKRSLLRTGEAKKEEKK